MSRKKITTAEAIAKAIEVHSDTYGYDEFIYNGRHSKSKIRCYVHGIFEQEFGSHVSGRGCSKCGYKKMGKDKVIHQSDVIERFIIVNGNKYGYDFVEYTGNHNKVKIECFIHGIFEQTPANHYKGQGCPKCGCEKNRLQLLKNKDDFITDSIKVHGNYYDYSLIEYNSSHVKIKIICPNHGVFEQTPSAHINQKQGCPICKISKGERKIISFLEEMNIEFKYQHSFNLQDNRKRFKYDFFISKNNLLIEYDGKQHFSYVSIFHVDEMGFMNQKKRDKEKNDLAKELGIKMIRIPYTSINSINEILTKELMNE